MNLRAVYPALLTAALALAVAAPGFGGFPESFKAGIRAVDYKEWPQVVSAMRQAIAEQPRATGENVRIYGMRVAPYIPHYFLGLGLFRQGDCSGAMDAFTEAEAQGTARGLFRARMNFIQDLCAQRLGRPRTRPGPSSHPSTLSSGTSPPPGRNPGSIPPGGTARPQAAPVPGPAPAPAVVRQKALDEVVQDGRQWLTRGEKLVRTLDEHRRADPRRFDRDPTRAEILMVAKQRLNTAAFQLQGCQREGDLDGAEKARDDAHAAWEMLDQLMKDI